MVMNILIIKKKNSTPLLPLIKFDYRHGEQQKIGNKSYNIIENKTEILFRCKIYSCHYKEMI